MNATAAPKLEVGAKFGFRSVVEVTSKTVSYINLNGRKPEGKKQAKVHTLPKAEFKALVGLD